MSGPRRQVKEVHSNEEVSLQAVSRLVAAARCLMRPHRHWDAWDTGIEGEEQQFLCGLDVVGGETQQYLADSNKVHDLGNAKERGDDQRPAAGALHEGARTLLGEDLPAIGWARRDEEGQ